MGLRHYIPFLPARLLNQPPVFRLEPISELVGFLVVDAQGHANEIGGLISLYLLVDIGLVLVGHALVLVNDHVAVKLSLAHDQGIVNKLPVDCRLVKPHCPVGGDSDYWHYASLESARGVLADVHDPTSFFVIITVSAASMSALSLSQSSGTMPSQRWAGQKVNRQYPSVWMMGYSRPSLRRAYQRAIILHSSCVHSPSIVLRGN